MTKWSNFYWRGYFFRCARSTRAKNWESFRSKVSARETINSSLGLTLPLSNLLTQPDVYPDLMARSTWDHFFSRRSLVTTAPMACPRVLVSRLILLLTLPATHASSALLNFIVSATMPVIILSNQLKHLSKWV